MIPILVVSLSDEWVLGAIAVSYGALAAALRQLYKDNRRDRNTYERLLVEYRTDSMERMEKSIKVVADLTASLREISGVLKEHNVLEE